MKTSHVEQQFSNMNNSNRTEDDYIYKLRRRRTPSHKRRFSIDMTKIQKEIQQRVNEKSQDNK